MVKFWLTIIRWLNPLWRRLHVNPGHLTALMEARLLMESRRKVSWQQNKPASSGTRGWLVYLSFFLIGAGALFAISRFDHIGSALTLYFLIWMVFFSITLISDFTDVLIDIRENYIVLPRPVSDRTISTARLLHIIIYLMGLTLPFILPALIYFFIRFGLAGSMLFLFLQLLSELMVVFGINLIYLGILRFATPARFKDMIGYFQIGLTIFIFAAYYLTPKLLDWDRVAAVNFLEKPLASLLPPAWLGSIWVLLWDGMTDTTTLFRTFLGVAAPIGGIWLVIRYLARGFNRKLMAISLGLKEDNSQKPPKAAGRTTWGDKLGALLCLDAAEKAAFNLTWLVTARSRDFKVKVYPSFGFIPVFFLYMAIQGQGTLQERVEEIKNGNHFLLLLYMLLVAISTPLLSVRHSDKYKASWLFFVTPVRRKGALVSGAFKAIMAKYFLPFYILSALFTLAFWGIKTAPHIVLALVNLILVGCIIAYMAKALPFSSPWEDAKKGGQVATSFISTLAIGMVGGGHYILVLFAPGWFALVTAAILLVPLFFLMKGLSRQKW